MEFYERLVLQVIENHPLIEPDKAANKATEYYTAAVEKWNDISLRSITDAEHPQYPKPVENPVEKEPEEKVDNQLHLFVDPKGWLCATYKEKTIIAINTEGKLYGPASLNSIKEYEKWLERNEFSGDVVRWRGKEYSFDTDSLRCEDGLSYIFDFVESKPYDDCGDDNIIRYKYSNTPIIH